MTLDTLGTIVDFNQIEILDIACIESVSRQELPKLIKHLPRLNYLAMEFNPLFVVPSQIRTVRLVGDCK
jgi:Leucine-rich repeat (LRR) protein